MEHISAAAARRIALAAQGFADKRPAAPGRRHLLKTVERLGVVQIDSVNVVSRTHYLPFFSRLGAYPRPLLEEIAWGRKPALVEYWAHEASLTLPTTRPLLQWRMDDARAGVGVWRGIAKFLRSHEDFIAKALKEIETRGPLSASELSIGAKGAGSWWGWGEGKRALESLFWIGDLATATRRSTFERVYGVPNDVLPAQARTEPPPRDEAQRQLLRIAARAQGVATERDLRDYFRMGVTETKARIAELVETGELVPVKVEGWDNGAYLHRDARRPRKVVASALLSPFDNLIWFRERTERLFGTRIRLEIYTPAHKRVHGYYVLPFLQDEAITARVDLKAERRKGVLLVQAAHAEPGANGQTAARLAGELKLMAGWLALDRVEVAPKGDLAAAVAAALAG
ncbi:winged helix-turn-helix domain-containing protein [Phenylobacterium koreense]|uniref:Uncharacterized protein YcaQ n=1 Tax=Phenylobacterium koreense TaxID=266125 RepID=A0ABV2EJI2_9CAUL